MRPPSRAPTAAHGEPLGEEEIRGAKRFYGWPEDETFLVPDEVYEHFDAGIGARGAGAARGLGGPVRRYAEQYPELADQLDRMQRRDLPEGWDERLPEFPADPKGLAGRDANGQVLNVVAQNVPWLIGGSSDLAPSTKTLLTFEGAGDFRPRTGGAQPALRRPRARRRLHRQRAVAVQGPALRPGS